MLGLVVVTKLDLTLVSGKVAGLLEGDGMGAVQNVITGLHRERNIPMTLSTKTFIKEDPKQSQENRLNTEYFAVLHFSVGWSK